MPNEARQFVRFLFLRLDPAWRRLPAPEQVAQKLEFGGAIRRFRARLMLRSYSLAGTRGDADLLLWQVADEIETFQALQTVLFSTGLGGHLSVGYSYLGMTRRSIYVFPELPEVDRHIELRPQETRFLFVYPFVKTREWYALPLPERQRLMEDHVRIGRNHPGVRLNTVYSFGLDDQEFVVAFETDEPGDFLDLVMELRETEASRYTLRDTPIFTCIQMSLWEALDALGGTSTAGAAGDSHSSHADGFTEVSSLRDLPDGTARRVYLGRDAIALFNVGGKVYAVSDRCTHGRASLSEGIVEPDSCILQCPWHGGRFNLGTGQPAAPPVRVPIKTYRVKVEEDRILVG
jgi:chlorite dismutase